MDSALKLKIELDNGLKISKAKALQYLNESVVVSRLTDSIIDKPLYYVWRLIALSEIPFAEHLDYTKKLIEKVYKTMSTPFGFSLSGDEKNFLPCYNAMLVTALCRLGKAEDLQVKKAVDWINENQPMERNQEFSIPNFDFKRYGGCFKSTPCYIGLAKSVIALFHYYKATGNDAVKDKLDQGIEYMLQHHLIYRFSCNKPITKHILDISFPESYNLNIVELIRFASQAELLHDKRTEKTVDYLQNIKTNKGIWKINYRYRADGYMVFDKGRGNNEWVSYIINKALDKV